MTHANCEKECPKRGTLICHTSACESWDNYTKIHTIELEKIRAYKAVECGADKMRCDSIQRISSKRRWK